MNICPKCGAEVEGLFCPECGTKIEVDKNISVTNTETQAVQTSPTIQTQQAPISTQQTVPYVRSDASGSALVQAAEKKSKGFAIASLVLGIISICSFGILFIPETLGIVFALISRDGKTMSKMAKAGMICSIVGLCMFFLLLLI